ncbi:MAG TPA: peptide ABC transporter substrate-binding protein [Polyangiaceae bacterium]|nr:peptide ABC transporter substrate-binding protein [Polyangiaceae bacterium]
MLRSWLYFIGFLALGLLLVGLTFSAASLERADFAFVNLTEPKTLDPGAMTGEPEGRLADALFEGLTRLDGQTLESAPGVAESWKISADGTRYEFTLRPNARWSDGRPLTAHDVTFAWRRLVNPRFGSEYAYLLNMVKFAEAFNSFEAQSKALERAAAALEERADPSGRLARATFLELAKKLGLPPIFAPMDDRALSDWLRHPEWIEQPGGVREFTTALRNESRRRLERYRDAERHFGIDAGVFATDDHHVTVELVAPTPYFLELTAFYPTYPLPRHAIEKFGDERWFLPGHIVSNGAFVLDQWRVGDRIRMLRSPTYWDRGRVKLRSVDALPSENATTSLNLFLSGEVDWLPTNSYPVDLSEYLAQRPDYFRSSALSVYFYRINCTRKPFDDPRVRLAINLAVDREVIAKQVVAQGQIPAYRVVGPGIPGYPEAETPLRYDVAQARKLLAEAGFPDGRGFPKFGVLYNTMDMHRKIAEVIADQLRRNLGIQATAYNQEWQSYLTSYRALDYDLSRAGWVPDYLDPNTFLDLWVTDGGNNSTGFSDATYDELIRAASNVERFLKAPELRGGTFSHPERIERAVQAVRDAATPDQHLAQAVALRMELLREAETRLFSQGPPILPIYFYVNSGMINPKVRGFHWRIPDGKGGWRSNVRDRHPISELSVDGR